MSATGRFIAPIPLSVHRAVAISSSIAAVACASAPLEAPAEAPPPPEARAGLRGDGSIVVPGLGGGEPFELSAPLVPCSIDLANRTGERLPRTRDELQSLARRSLPYEFFLERCAPAYPDIALEGDAPASPEALRRNLIATELCVVERFGARGQWLPWLVSHVDVCEEVLGKPWNVPDTLTMAHWTPPQVRFLQSELEVPGLWRFGTPIAYAHDSWSVHSSTLLPVGMYERTGTKIPRGRLMSVRLTDLDGLVKGYTERGRPRRDLELDPSTVALRCVRPGRPEGEPRLPARATPAAIDCAERMTRSIGEHPALLHNHSTNDGQMLHDLVRAFDIWSTLQQERKHIDVDGTRRRIEKLEALKSLRVGGLFVSLNRSHLMQASKRLLTLVRQQCRRPEPKQVDELARLDPLLDALAHGRSPWPLSGIDPTSAPLPLAPKGRQGPPPPPLACVAPGSP